MRKVWMTLAMFTMIGCASTVDSPSSAPTPVTSGTATRLFLDTHDLGQVKASDVAEAHKKDVAIQAKYGVTYKAYWVDEEHGKIYCLAQAPSAEAASRVHGESHGLVAQKVVEVTADNMNWTPTPGATLYLDVHKLGKGNVTPQALADAHKKDLATQSKYGVRYLNYWLDQESGTVWCLVEAPNAEAAVAVHKEAHGLVPDTIVRVTEGR